FLEEDEADLDEFVRDLSVSPAGSFLAGRRPQSQAFGTRGPSLESFRASVSSSRMSLSLSPPGPADLSPERSGAGGGGIRLSLNPRHNSPGRFDLSPGRSSSGRSPLTPTEKADLSAAAALSAKVSWDCTSTPPALGALKLPQRLFDGDEADGDLPDDGGADGVLDCASSEERFDGNSAEGFGAQGGGGGMFVAERGGSFGRGARASSGGDDGGGEGEGIAGSSREEGMGRGLRVSASGSCEDLEAKAQRLSVLSIVGAGSLSEE
ncbi:unnamed protein product, partial [Scytosiphon promiscuus]